ncbi:MAG TPA: Rieske (2Fe-2S) protein [Nocardioides sp.]|nr:Rieske (2Fe-2S) protein [Nocardioides sp.]
MTGPLTRRSALTGAATLGVSLPLLAACGDGGDETANDPSTPAGAKGSSSAPSSSKGGAGLVATADVPVGSGVVLKDEQVVVTQPSAGEFKAFSAVCTHQQCMVGSVADGNIVCPCHGSRFSVADGSVTGGPAPSPLPEVKVTVQDDKVVRS